MVNLAASELGTPGPDAGSAGSDRPRDPIAESIAEQSAAVKAEGDAAGAEAGDDQGQEPGDADDAATPGAEDKGGSQAAQDDSGGDADPETPGGPPDPSTQDGQADEPSFSLEGIELGSEGAAGEISTRVQAALAEQAERHEGQARSRLRDQRTTLQREATVQQQSSQQREVLHAELEELRSSDPTAYAERISSDAAAAREVMLTALEAGQSPEDVAAMVVARRQAEQLFSVRPELEEIAAAFAQGDRQNEWTDVVDHAKGGTFGYIDRTAAERGASDTRAGLFKLLGATGDAPADVESFRSAVDDYADRKVREALGGRPAAAGPIDQGGGTAPRQQRVEVDTGDPARDAIAEVAAERASDIDMGRVGQFGPRPVTSDAHV